MPRGIDHIPYMNILREAWKITWKHRTLWWLGLFMAITGGLSWNGPGIRGEKNGSQATEQITNFISQHIDLVLGAAAAFLVLFILFLVLGIIARGGAIKSINDLIANKNTPDFRAGMREGKRFFWRMFLLGLLTFISILLAFIVLFTPVIFLFLAEAYVVGVLLAIMAAVIMIPLAILAFFINTYGYIYIATSELSAWQAFENAYDLFVKNIASSIVMGLILIPIGIVLGLGILAILLFFVLTFGLMAGLLYLVTGKIGAIVIVAVGSIIFLALLLAIRSVYEIFTQTAWILFFREIATSEEEVKEILEEIEHETNTVIPAASDAIKTLESEK